MEIHTRLIIFSALAALCLLMKTKLAFIYGDKEQERKKAEQIRDQTNHEIEQYSRCGLEAAVCKNLYPLGAERVEKAKVEAEIEERHKKP